MRSYWTPSGSICDLRVPQSFCTYYCKYYRLGVFFVGGDTLRWRWIRALVIHKFIFYDLFEAEDFSRQMQSLKSRWFISSKVCWSCHVLKEFACKTSCGTRSNWYYQEKTSFTVLNCYHLLFCCHLIFVQMCIPNLWVVNATTLRHYFSSMYLH